MKIVFPNGEEHKVTSEEQFRDLLGSVAKDEAEERVATYAELEKVKNRLKKKGYIIK